MATPPEKLASSLAALRSLQDRGVVAVRAADLARTHRERLVRSGFLQPVMKGWYIAGSADQGAGDIPDMLRRLLAGGHSTVAGRLRDQIAHSRPWPHSPGVARGTDGTPNASPRQRHHLNWLSLLPRRL